MRRAFTLIEVLVVISITGLLVVLLLPAVHSAREAARRLQCQSNLNQIGLALAGYESTHAIYPFGVGGGGPPYFLPRWSAQSQLLPHLDQGSLFNALNFGGLPWAHHPVFGISNQTALATQVETFLCPSDLGRIADRDGTACNNYRACAGTEPYNLISDTPGGQGVNDGVFWFQSAVKVAAIRDGTNTTAAFSERCLGNATRPDPKGDYYYVSGSFVDTCALSNPAAPQRFAHSLEWSGQRWADGNALFTRYQNHLTPQMLSCTSSDTDTDGQLVVTATSRHPGGVSLLTLDGSVRFVKETIALPTWRALGTIAGSD
jgi:prepilin-type N-terminal cleavage/methylation domain-containing protein